MKMNPEVKQKWVTALRGGEYKQGKHALRLNPETGPVHCCLGVLCDLHSKETGTEWTRNEYYFGEASQLPPEVTRWAGLGEYHTGVAIKVPMLNGAEDPDDPFSGGSSLIGANDRFGMNFNQIAELIEQQL